MKHINYNTKKGSTVCGTVVEFIKKMFLSDRYRAFLKWTFVSEIIILIGIGIAYLCIDRTSEIKAEPKAEPVLQYTESGIYQETDCGIDVIDDLYKRQSFFRYLASEYAPPFFQWIEQAKERSHKARIEAMEDAKVYFANAVANNDLERIAYHNAYIIAYQIADSKDVDTLYKILLTGAMAVLADEIGEGL